MQSLDELRAHFGVGSDFDLKQVKIWKLTGERGYAARFGGKDVMISTVLFFQLQEAEAEAISVKEVHIPKG